MNREVELAKKLLESKGYEVSKKLREAHTVELYKSHGEDPERKRFSDYKSAKEFADSQTANHEEIIITIPTVNGPSTVNSWSKTDGWYRTVESKKVNESEIDDARREYHQRVAKYQHPNDSVGYPDFDEKAYEKQKAEGEEREKAFISKRRKEEGAPDDYEYDGRLNKFVKYNNDKTGFEIWDESEEVLKPQNESDSVDDRQQRRIVRSIANEVIQSRGENNSIGTYDAFIRKMIDNWATSGQDRDFIKAAIEKSFDKEFRVKESQVITISKPDDLVGHNPKFRVTYSAAPGETTSMTIEATDERAVEAIISGRFKRRGKTPPKFLSIERVSDIKESKKMNESLSTVRSRAMLKALGFNISMLRDNSTSGEHINCFCDMRQKDKHKYYIISCTARNCNSEDEEKKVISEFIKDVHDINLDIGKPAPKVPYGARAVIDIDALAPIFDSKKIDESSDTPHSEQYKGYSIQSYDDYGATIYKNGKKIREFENIDDAREYIDGLNESKSPLQKAILKSIERLHESSGLDYDEMQYWNPIAIGSKVADYLGTDATQEEIESEISKILDRSDSKFQRAVDEALHQIEIDKESMSYDPMQGNKYHIGGSTPNVTETGTDYDIHDGGYTDDPELAIIKWLRLSKNSPMSISIDTNKNAHAQELLQWVVDNEEKFRKLCAEYNCPYKIDYMIDGCKKKLERPSNFETKYNYPDQIYPFAIG